MMTKDKEKGDDSFDIMDVVASRARAAVDEVAAMEQQQQWNACVASKACTVTPNLADGDQIEPGSTQPCKSAPRVIA